MRRRNDQPQTQDEEEITITLPASALKTLGMPPGSQLGSGHGGLESSSSIIAAAATQNEPFPCFKKSAWGDQIIVKITQEHSAPRTA